MQNCHPHREPHFCCFALQQLMPFVDQFPIQYLTGKQGCQIAYRHFVHQQSAVKKLLILVNGRAENILKWSELAYDFYQWGYDVLLFDHRGQGYSQRLLADKEKGYIDEFRFYTEDMNAVIKQVTRQCDYSQQYLLAHSLGSLISAYYLANYDHHIQRAVLSSPFFGLPTKHLLRDELIINLMMLFGQGQRYVFGKAPYKPANLQHNELSFCKTRMKWMNRINRYFPELSLGGPTFRWVHLCLTAIKGLEKILPRIEIPVLVLQAGKEKIVANDRLEKLVSRLPQGQLITLENAKHEILFERDPLRTQALEAINAFISQPATTARPTR
ncbi:alpha/beta fold hydrolase [Avibacterium paragallinarum]|uniref:alpha/beta fold hydrolase n=1 Tax=Avibacterium paragallinarum TaxID=728 RepID=UPI0021F721F3|nr:alpha/beta hydrolase [Avibacterium paragallinarum]UXN34969.1 alpha/beta hydrolase [Avibacterium paragallinarum]